MDATTPNQARRIAACAEAACELEVPTNEVGPKEQNSIYVLCTLLRTDVDDDAHESKQ